MSTRVLVVEDDLPLAEFLAERLRDDRFTAAVAHDGAEAERLIAAENYDILILDLALPTVHGLQVLRWARSKFPELLILVLTGSATPEDCVKSLDAGADDFITKPFSYAELSARMRALLLSQLKRESRGKIVLRVEDLELDRVGCSGAARRLQNRADSERVRATRISDAARPAAGAPDHDQRACLGRG